MLKRLHINKYSYYYGERVKYEDINEYLDIHKKKNCLLLLEHLETSALKYNLSYDEIENLSCAINNGSKFRFIILPILMFLTLPILISLIISIATWNNFINILIPLAFYTLFIGIPFTIISHNKKNIIKDLENLKNGDYFAYEIPIDKKMYYESGGEDSSTFHFIESKNFIFKITSFEYKSVLVGENAVIIAFPYKNMKTFRFLGLDVLKLGYKPWLKKINNMRAE